MDQASSSSNVKEEKRSSTDPVTVDENEEREAIEIPLFQVPECYVYLIPPRKSAASYRADEWDVNKWAWEGALKVVSKGEECIIKLVDKTTGELYAQAFLRDGELHPVEAVIDSSSLKEGETIVLQLKNRNEKDTKTKLVEKSLSNLSLEDKGKSIETIPPIIPPPPPPGPLSPAATTPKSPSSLSLQRSSEQQDLDTKREEVEKKEDQEAKEIGAEDAPDDDFGDFQAAG
ncbi:hypothetical protein HID58_014049 [Brassica napus]|uniref:NECAP PHear domain-containing protein n=1 Tax=Brassica napus TaxID=3708 RepID=A0ABQ8DG54_BRANA|nr:hypothetical protein HID58_014049 [Brassica napus]